MNSVYGYCPKCGGKGVTRERRIDGNDTCERGCVYPSCESLMKPQLPEPTTLGTAYQMLRNENNHLKERLNHLQAVVNSVGKCVNGSVQ